MDKYAKLEACLTANERELWDITQKHDKLIHFVQTNLWHRVAMTMGAEVREQLADELYELGCEVEA